MPYVRDPDGRWHTIYDQTKTDSCGPTSVRILVKMATGRDLGEEYARQLVEKAPEEEAYFGPNTASTLTSQGSAYKAGAHDWGDHGHHGTGTNGGMGSLASDLRVVLQRLGFANAIVRGATPANLLRSSVKQPGIAFVQWGGAAGIHGGAHFVVVAGALKNGKVLVLDPAFGVQQMSVSTGGGGAVAYAPGGAHGEVLEVILTQK